MDLQLEGKTALVTGSYRGTGQIIARTLLQEGASVLVHGFTQEQAQTAVEALGGGMAVSGDITSSAGSDSLVADVRKQLDSDHVDILINNYGTVERSRWQDSSEQDWLLAYQQNVLSAQRLIQHFLPAMQQKRWGRIINLGTIGSTSPNSRNPAYYSAKGALATMTVSLAKEVGDSGVGVNLVSPGLILTPEVQAAYLEKGQREGWGETWEDIEPRVAADIPTRRIARREEIAALVAFLCSPLAAAIHGENLHVDGGGLGVVT